MQMANANLNPFTEAKLDPKNPERGPLLIIDGEKSTTRSVGDRQRLLQAPEAQRGRHRDHEDPEPRALADDRQRLAARSPRPRSTSSSGSSSAAAAAGRAGATARPGCRPASRARRPPRRSRRARGSVVKRPSSSESGSGSGARKWTVRSIVGAGCEGVEQRPRRRKPGVGEDRDRRRVERAALAQAEPAADLAAVGAAERRVAEAVLHRQPLGERRRVVAGEVAGGEVAVAIGRRAAVRVGGSTSGIGAVVELRALPGLRVGGERERDQLVVLLEAAADGRQRAPGALDRRRSRGPARRSAGAGNGW